MSEHRRRAFASVRHDLRTPLSSILGFAEILEQGLAGDLNEEQREFVETIRRKGELLLSMLNHLSEVGHLPSPSRAQEDGRGDGRGEISGEEAKLRIVEEVFGVAEAPVSLGIGDDAAAISLSGQAVLSVDCAVEGIHFRREWASWEQIGDRALTSALSDLAAMAAAPRAALLALVLPAAFQDEALRALLLGARRAAKRVGAQVIGGNLSSGEELSITSTVLGEALGEPLRREGAAPGDRIYVTGTLGAAALGRALLARGLAHDPRARPFVEAFRVPRARIAEASKIAAGASAAIDLSDGLVLDLGRLARASGVRAELELEALPTFPAQRALAEELGLDPLALALEGGDDYELLFTWREEEEPPVGHRIGRVREGEPGVDGVSGEGEARSLGSGGYQHFP